MRSKTQGRLEKKYKKGSNCKSKKQLYSGTVEMEIRGSMMSVREDIRILDATLRDGGLVNNGYSITNF